jgi:hypothetical protein
MAVALPFGLISIPLVATSLVQALPEWQQNIVDAPSLGWLAALVLAAGSVIPASIIGGGLGGQFVRSRPVAGAIVAIAVAWPVGIAMLSITASLAGISLETAILCIDTCTPQITNLQPGSGLAAYATALVVGQVFIVPPVAGVVLLLLARWTAKRHRLLSSLVLSIAAYGAVHLMSVTYGGLAFPCLAIGITVWAVLLREKIPAEEPQAAVTDPSPEPAADPAPDPAPG